MTEDPRVFKHIGNLQKPAMDSVGEMGETDLAGALVLFATNSNGEDEPTPLNSFHPNVSDWVI